MTKLVLTVRRSMNVVQFVKMIEAGVTCFRLNASRFEPQDLLGIASTIRILSTRLGREVEFFVDLPGTKARIWNFGGDMKVDNGSRLRVLHSGWLCRSGPLQLVGDVLFRQLRPGTVLKVRGSGPFRLRIENCREDSFTAVAVTSGYIGAGNHITIEGPYLSAQELSHADKYILPTVAEISPNYIAASFADSPAILCELRRRLGMLECNSTVLAKVESPEAVKNAGIILAESSGAVIGRDDLALWFDSSCINRETCRIVRYCRERDLVSIPASNYFQSLAFGEELSDLDLLQLNQVIELGPEYLYCNETGRSFPIDRIIRIAKSLDMLHVG